MCYKAKNKGGTKVAITYSYSYRIRNTITQIRIRIRMILTSFLRFRKNKSEKAPTKVSEHPIVEVFSGEHFHLVCCDCSLTHQVSVEVVGTLVRIEFLRDELKTAQMKRIYSQIKHGS